MNYVFAIFYATLKHEVDLPICMYIDMCENGLLVFTFHNEHKSISDYLHVSRCISNLLKHIRVNVMLLHYTHMFTVYEN